MLENRTYKLLGICILVTSYFALQGCRNSDFDLSDIDATMGFGSDSISLPGNNSSEYIKLKDVLKLDNSDCVDTLGNGNYVFSKTNDDIAAAHPIINTVNIKSQTINNTYIVSLFGSSTAKSRSLQATTSSLSFGGKVSAFDCQYNNIPTTIQALDYVTMNSNITIKLTFSTELQRNIKTLSTLNVTFPMFMDISSATVNGTTKTIDSNNQITLADVSTSGDVVIKLMVKRMNLNAKETIDTGNTISFTKGSSINIKGYIDINGTFGTSDMTTTINKSACTIKGDMDISTMNITAATGKFNPSIDFDNIGKVELNSIPDFLKDNAVNMDLYNPMIVLNVTSDMPLKGLISGTLTSKYNDGRADVAVKVPQFSINANTTTKVCICKNKSALTDTYDEVIEVTNLSDIIESIPQSITFGNISAQGDDGTTATVQLGKSYTVKPTYKIEAPLAFSADAQIVYNDTLDGWNKSVKDLNINKQVQLTADVENGIPVYLTVTAQAINTSKQLISSDDISIDVQPTVPAYNATTQKKGTAQLVVTIKQNKDGVFKNLDGIIFKAVGAAQADGQSAIEGVAINASKQTLRLTNVKAKISGKIIADFN